MNSDNNYTSLENDEISIKELILKVKELPLFLLTHWKTIILFGIIGAAIGFTYAYSQKPIYKAELTFAIEDEKNGGGGGLSSALGLASSFGIDLGGGGAGGVFSGANLMALMKSRKIIEKTLLSNVEVNGKPITLVEYYIAFNKMRTGRDNNTSILNVNFPVNPDRSLFSIQQDSVLKIISKKILERNLQIIQVDKKVSIIGIQVSSIDEKFSKWFCEKIANIISEYYVELKTKKAKLNVAILEKQVDSIKSRLNYSTVGTWGAERINIQVASTILGQLSTNLELAKITLRKETPLLQVVDSPNLPLEIEKVSKKYSILIGTFLAQFICILFLLLNSYLKRIT